MAWDGSPRATVPLPYMRASRDVLSPTCEDAKKSPYPFGLAVYAWRKGHVHEKKRLSLFYVSKCVADDRSPKATAQNPGGVREGWYVMAQPDTEFEVRVSRVNQKEVGQPHEDGFAATIYVDGESVHSTFLMRQYSDSKYEFVYTGFVERRVKSRTDPSSYEKQVRHFAFEKSLIAGESDEEDTEVEPSEAGTIRLSVTIGTEQPSNRLPSFSTETISQGPRVQEKDMVKQGKSLVSSRSGDMQRLTRTVSSFEIVNRRDLAEAGVTVYVREFSWLRSRRLIDDHGLPCTHERYRNLLKEDNPNNKGKGRRSSEVDDSPQGKAEVKDEVTAVEERPSKRAKVKTDVINLDPVTPIVPGEVIDLT